jgi:hypothetical protein
MNIKKLKIVLLMSMLLFITSNIYAQAFLDSLIFNDGVDSRTRYYGLDLTATNGIDVALGEENLPPTFPPGIEVRFDLTPAPISASGQTYRDFRNASVFPFSGTVEHRLVWQYSSGATGMTISYNLPTGVQIRLTDAFGLPTALFDSGLLSGSGSFLVPNATSYNSAKLFITYTNVSAAGPQFSAAPTSPLTIVPTAIGGSNTGSVTVTNTGSAPLDITGITSSNGQFTISPLTANIPVGGNQPFTVTFSPIAPLGPKTTNLVFTHNAPTLGSTTTYVVNGVAASAGPTFAVSPSSLNFGTINQGATTTATVTINNNGLTNQLNITAATTAAPYSVSPLTANIIAGSSQVFTVTFAPTAGGSFPGTLTFTHNDPVAGTVSAPITLAGSAVSVFGLVFSQDSVTRKEDSTYTDVIQLKSLSAKAQAIQFRLLVNKSPNDNTILRFQNIQKGANVAAADWSLQYEVFRGPFTSNGSSIDSIYVLLYNLNEDSGLPGNLAGVDYDSLLKVNYSVADIEAADTLKSSFIITNAEASTFQGFPITITPSRSELVVLVKNRASSYGDINGDGSLDILDLINVVDHILGRDSLDANEFARANIAPWAVGSSAPSPDAFVNVQDLSLIQNIILTGLYPDGTTLNKPAYYVSPETLDKSTTADAKIIFNITHEGIAVSLESNVAIRGAQLEFGSVEDPVNGMIIDSRLGDGFYAKLSEMLRVLLYDQAGNAVIEAGNNFIANLPFIIENPEAITADKVILVNTNKEKLLKIEIEIIYGSSVELPVDYALFQNYPNPFNPTTTIRFSVPETNNVTINVFNTLGEEVRTLFLGQVERGTYSMKWDGKDNSGSFVSSGMYIYKMTAGQFNMSKKMMYLK